MIQVLREGQGEPCHAGQTVSADYVGAFLDGRQFDSSLGREPIEFELGSGMVIKGWDEGLEGMRIGEKRRLTIPPDLAYGEKGVGPIPANSTLVFEVELKAIKE